MNDAGQSVSDGRPVGAWLKEEREHRRLSVNEVADQLHLRPSVVTSIETGSNAELAGEIFLRGYVKSYARLLELDQSAIMGALGPQQSASFVVESMPAKKAPSHRNVFGLIVLATVLSAAGLYWFADSSSFDKEGSSQSTAAETSQSPVAESMVPAADDRGEVASDSRRANGVVPDEVATSEPDGEPPVSSVAPSQAGLLVPTVREGAEPLIDMASDVAAEAETDRLGPAPEVEVAAPLGEEIRLDAASLSDTGVAGNAPAPVTVGKVVFRFSGDCWIEMFDGKERKVLADLKGAGETLSYEGALPFRVILGAVSATEVTFNGEAFDFANVRVRNNRAQFLLDVERR